MFGALKPRLRSVATLKLVVNVVGELLTEKNSYGIARFPCDTKAFLLALQYVHVLKECSSYGCIIAGIGLV